MASFDKLMEYFGPKCLGEEGKHKLDRGHPNIVYYNLVLGALAGTIAVTATYPTDLTRKLLQLNGQPGHNYTGIVDVCKQLYRNEGIYGFYKGLWATYLKVAPMTAILFLCNEQLKRIIGI